MCGHDIENEVSESIHILRMASRHPRGLFIAGIELHRDKVAFQIFVSRPTPLADLKARLTLADNVGTTYVMQTDTPEIIDGKAVIEFTPGLPPTAGSLALHEPGCGTNIAAPKGSTIYQSMSDAEQAGVEPG